jgi:hypothetical protein
MSEREPQLAALVLGEWHHEWSEWTAKGGELIVWVEDLPVVNEGDKVSLHYRGARKGETLHPGDVPVKKIEGAHGGFHIVLNAGRDVVDEIAELHPSEAVTT